MSALPRAEVAYFRVAEVHTAHFGLGNVLPDDSYEGWKRKCLSTKGRKDDETTYIFHDGVDARKFDDSPAINGTLNNQQFKIFCLTLWDAYKPHEMAGFLVVFTSSSSGSSMPQNLRRFSAVRMP